MQMQHFFQILQYILGANTIDIIAGDLNYNILQILGNKHKGIFTDNFQMANKPSDISGCLIDHIYMSISSKL